MDNTDTVEVLLATFNGERYLRQQIESILNQDYKNICIVARDDGSTDATMEILRGYQDRFPNRFRVLDDCSRTGSAKTNFLHLMKKSQAKYICFADQDDVWLLNKISLEKEAISRLEHQWGSHVPALVFTDLQLVDQNLKTICDSFWKFMKIDPGQIDRLARLLLQSVVTGCTAMLNRPLLELALRMPEDAYMHDRWIGLLVSIFGRAKILRERTVLYRQHDRNVIGTGRKVTKERERTKLQAIWEKIRHVHTGATAVHWKIAQQQAKALLNVHGAEIPENEKRILEAFRQCETDRNRTTRVRLLLKYGFYDVGFLSNLAKLVMLLSHEREVVR